jgi:hypothetical protein
MNELPEQFQNLMGMGSVQAVFPVRKMSKWGSLIVGVLSLLATGLIFLMGIWYVYDRTSQYGPAVLLDSLIAPLVIAVIAFLIAFFSLWSAISNWKKAVVVYQNGFAYSDRKGVQDWRWEDVESLTAAITRHYTNGIYTGTTHVYTLRKRDSTRLVLNDTISKVESAADSIRQGAFAVLYPRYAQAYNTGQTVVFGPVALSKANGIQIGKKTYPWSEVAKVSINKGFVQVAKKGGGWFSGASAAASQIPNLEVMLHIINQIIGVKTG